MKLNKIWRDRDICTLQGRKEKARDIEKEIKKKYIERKRDKKREK